MLPNELDDDDNNQERLASGRIKLESQRKMQRGFGLR